MIIGDQELGFADPLVAGLGIEPRDFVPQTEIGRCGTLLVVEQTLVGEIADSPDPARHHVAAGAVVRHRAVARDVGDVVVERGEKFLGLRLGLEDVAQFGGSFRQHVEVVGTRGHRRCREQDQKAVVKFLYHEFGGLEVILDTDLQRLLQRIDQSVAAPQFGVPVLERGEGQQVGTDEVEAQRFVGEA